MKISEPILCHSPTMKMYFLFCTIVFLNATQLALDQPCQLHISNWYRRKRNSLLRRDPPAYQLAQCYGNGANDWTVHLEDGGWHYNDSDCGLRNIMEEYNIRTRPSIQISTTGYVLYSTLSNKTVADWFFDQITFQEIKKD